MTSTRHLHEKLTTGLVEIGLSPAEANAVVNTVIDAVENAALSASITLEIGLGSIAGRHGLPSMHLALQVLVARLEGMVDKLQTELIKDGAETSFVDFGVRTDG